jgi:hypothetical protein
MDGAVMRRFVATAVAFTLASASPAVAYEPPFSRTGFHIGANVGYSWGHASACQRLRNA